jgi:hypothetical protein
MNSSFSKNSTFESIYPIYQGENSEKNDVVVYKSTIEEMMTLMYIDHIVKYEFDANTIEFALIIPKLVYHYGIKKMKVKFQL